MVRRLLVYSSYDYKIYQNMNPKTSKIIYWTTTGLLCLMMLGSAGMYIANYETVQAIFIQLNYPPHVIYPLAIAKILGVIAILTKKSNTLKEWAYAGFFFDFVLAFLAHWMVNDGQWAPPLVAMTLLLISYNFEKRALGETTTV